MTNRANYSTFKNIFLLHLNYKQMTLALSTLKTSILCMLKYKTIILNIPLCYSKCHNVDILIPIMLKNGFYLALVRRDTLRPLGGRLFTPFCKYLST